MGKSWKEDNTGKWKKNKRFQKKHGDKKRDSKSDSASDSFGGTSVSDWNAWKDV